MRTTKNSSKKARLAVFLVISTVGSILVAASWGASTAMPALGKTAGEMPGRSLSPYFFIKSDAPDLDRMPLQSTRVDVNIAGVIADVKVTQLYKNTGKRPIEAIYVFPASTKASVYGMKMTIGERTVIAEIRRREEARRAYEQAKEAGKSASLLEQQRPNVFQMNVANILPGDEVKTELHYTELVTFTDGLHEFIFPTVVGPRYSNQTSAITSSTSGWIENPYLHQGELPSNELEILVQVNCGMPIREMTCSSHQADIQYLRPSAAKVTLARSETFSANRDFILKYRLTGDQIETGLLLYRGEDENFFLVMLQPPKEISESDIPPREYVFIVDVSGSMHGFPLDVSKKLLQDLIGGLRPVDVFNVLLFAGSSRLLAPQSIAATDQNIRRAMDLIDDQGGGGGTELLPALKRAFDLPVRERFSRTFVIATDGYVTVETETFDFIRKHLGESNFFTFGIGTSVNRYLIEGMARTGAGEPFVVTGPEEATAKAEKFRQYVQSPLLTNSKLVFADFSAFDVEPAGIPDVFAERPVVVFGKWKGEPKGKITLRGAAGTGEYHRTVDVGAVQPLSSNSALRYLWARSRIAQIDDYNRLSQNDKHITEVTELGLKYNLLTAYTSFVAIDTMSRTIDGKAVTVKQPLPLSEGVSDYAVGELCAGSALKSLAHHPTSPAPVYAGDSNSIGFRGETEDTFKDNRTNGKENEGRQGAPDQPAKIVKIAVSGVLPEEIVRRIVTEKLAQSQVCKVMVSTQSIEIRVKFTILESGTISEVHIDSLSNNSHEIGRCVVEAIKKWSFPAAGGRTVVAATIVFAGII